MPQVRWVSGKKSNTTAEATGRTKAGVCCETTPSLGTRTPKVDYGSLPVTVVAVPNSREDVPHENLGGFW